MFIFIFCCSVTTKSFEQRASTATTLLVLFWLKKKKSSLTSKIVKKGSSRLYIYINTHSPSPQYLPLSVCLSVSLTHPPTEQSFIPSVVIRPSLMLRGQGRDVHPQLLFSQRQTQELRLDNQLRTSVSFFVIGTFSYSHNFFMVRWTAWFDLKFLKAVQLYITNFREWMVRFHPNITSHPPFAGQYQRSVWPPAGHRSVPTDGQEGKDGQTRTEEWAGRQGERKRRKERGRKKL